MREIMKFLNQDRLFPAVFLKRYVPNTELETLTNRSGSQEIRLI